MTVQNRNILLLSLAVLIWASSYTITKTTVAAIPPFYFAFLRFVVASIAITAIGMRKKPPPQFFKKHFWSILLLALTGVTLYYLFFNLSLKYTTAATGALIQGFIPVAILILAVIILKEKVTRWQIAGIILSVAGVVIMASGGQATGEASSPLLGNLCMVASVFLWAGYTVISKRIAHADSMWLTIYSTVLGTILMIPVIVIELWDKPLPVISIGTWGSIIYLGVFASALSYFWYNTALKTLKASTVGSFLNMDPVIGAIIAIIFLGEAVFVGQVVGVALVLTGVWMNARKVKVKVEK